MRKKSVSVIRNWQLLRWRGKAAEADLSGENFVTVGKKAFSRKRWLEEVRFPAGLSALKTSAFSHCRRLSAVTLPEANSVGLSAGVFEGCARLHQVENSALLTVVGRQAFSGCSQLDSIVFGRELRRIGEHAFRNCRALTALTVPSCTEQIGAGAFAGCWELAQLELEDGLAALAPGMFRDCISLKEVTIPSSVRELPPQVFRGCTALTAPTIPGTVRRIGSSAFRGCRRLESVTLELGTAEIGAFAFAGDPLLRSVVIPHSLKKLGFGAFGLGHAKDKIVLSVDNEYMLRRLRRQLILCGSAGRAVVCMNGKTLAERKRERHRSSLEQTAPHIS